jgi:CheY-like chemotaxis protein
LVNDIVSGATVLVVDDEPMVRKLLQDIISSWGFHPVVCASGAEALAYARGHEPTCLCLLDLVMPEIDGIALARELQSHPTWRDVPIAFLSGLDRPPKLPPHVAYLQKPCLIGELFTLLSNHCRPKV